MRKLLWALLLANLFCCSSFCEQYTEQKNRIASEYASLTPTKWGENIEGVLTKLDTREKVIALTFDACGSAGDGFDIKLFEFLAKKNIPATFFISGRWIDRHPEEFHKISSNSLFEIENHGLNHKPASVNGKSVYGIHGTENPSELIDEVEQNGKNIEKLTGTKPQFYRSGTAFYDEVSVKIIHKLGYKIAGFSVLGDMGATYKKAQVEKALLNALSGSIIIFHINHPEKETGAGIISALPKLRGRGFRFVKLSEYTLK